MNIPKRDLDLLSSLNFDSNLEPNFERLKYCLIWEDERPLERLSSEGSEFLNDLWIVRGFIHRSLSRNEWGLDPKYFSDLWEFGLANVNQWPGFKRLVLSEVDATYLATCLHEVNEECVILTNENLSETSQMRVSIGKLKMTFGGYYLDEAGNRQQLEVIINPTKANIQQSLSVIRNRFGVACIRIDSIVNCGPQEITLYSEGGNYLVMLREIDDNESKVRTVTNLSLKNGLSLFHGEMYPSQAITDDFDLVCRIFEGFSVDGDISRKILN